MKENMDREIRKLLDKKNIYLSKAAENLDTITDQTKDANELFEALRISKKQDNGENISKQESEKLNDVKKAYESFFQDEDGNPNSTITGGLTDAIHSSKEDKSALLDKVNELRRKAKMIDNDIKEILNKSSLPESEGSTEMERNNKKRKSSLSEDSTEYESKGKEKETSLPDDSTEKETIGKEKETSLPDDSTEKETKDKKSSIADDSTEKELKEKEKKSSLLDDFADTSLEMPEIIDD